MSPLRPKNSPSFYKDVQYAWLRRFNGLANSSQEQWLLPSTDESYAQVARERGFPTYSVDLAEGGRGHWFGPASAHKVMVYFHGGGYGLPGSPAHFNWAVDLIKALQNQGYSISLVLLSYTLAPGATYPTQLKQACSLVRYLLDEEHKKPSDLLIAGDSAGGNLALAVLSHLLHPHPSIEPIRLSEPLGATILISPWVKFDTNARSFSQNALKDVVSPAALHRWAANFLDSAPSDPYSQPVLGPSDWFETLPDVVQSIYVYGGRQEVLIDSIEQMAETLSRVHDGVVFDIQEDGAHEDMIFEKMLGYQHKAKGTAWIENFIKERLK